MGDGIRTRIPEQYALHEGNFLLFFYLVLFSIGLFMYIGSIGRDETSKNQEFTPTIILLAFLFFFLRFSIVQDAPVFGWSLQTNVKLNESKY